MSDGLPLQERVEHYLQRRPDAGVPEIAGTLEADPREVSKLVDEGTTDPEGDLNNRTSSSGSRVHSQPNTDTQSRFTNWADADFSNPASGTWPDELLEREQWMGHVDKKPFAPWGDRNHPDADPDGDARWKWGITDNYVDGKTVAMAEDDPRLDGRAFLQRDDDPYVYVDGDDVRCPETGEIHPAFIAVLEHLGLTYADVSQSGAGVHAIYRGDTPENVKRASWRLDENSWGANEDIPSIEIYPGKRVCVMTGEHVPGTPVEIRTWNDTALEIILDANDQLPTTSSEYTDTAPATNRTDYDLEDYDPAATSSNETTSDIRDLFVAVDHLDAQRVAEKTIVQRWNDDATTSNGERAFWPTWGSVASDSGTANIVNDKRWLDTGDLGGYGGPVVMALIDAGEVSPRQTAPDCARGEAWWKGIEHLRKLGFDIPEYESSNEDDELDDHPELLTAAIEDEDDPDISSEGTSALPIKQLDALDPQERRRAAKRRGLEWPTTDEARHRLEKTINEVMRNEDDRVIDAPTSLGKTHTVAATRWGARDDLTNERPVVHLLETTDARDEAIATAKQEGGQHHVLLGRHEACPVAGGDHDPDTDEDAGNKQGITIDGEPASEWLDRQCNQQGKGMPFSAAHRYLEEHNDQNIRLPCTKDDGCHALKQWDQYREGPDDDSLDYWPLVIATHNFAFAPGLRMDNNVIVDEEPDFNVELSTERVRSAIGAYLREIDAPVTTWEAFIQLARHEGYGTDAAKERDVLDNALLQEPERRWYFENPEAHILAPALARAIFRSEERTNGRRFGKTRHKPPRLDASAREDYNWNCEWVSVVLDESNDVRSIRVVPDFGAARSVIGLDAHPAEPLWQANTVPWISITQVLEPEERQLWRRYERGLRVVQVGDATRPLSGTNALDWLAEDKLGALLEDLVDEYGTEFRTAITTAQVEDRLEELMDEAGCYQPELMHFGEEKSRNDFANESVGFVNGCMDPGDEYVLDLLAELDLDAEVETTVDGDGEVHRAKGRGFEGEDADVAAEILASVRENHVAQAAGRYARSPKDPNTTATVFVRTDAAPSGFVDVQTPGVQWTFTELQRKIVDQLRSNTGAMTARAIADEIGCSKEHVRKTLHRLEAEDVVQAFDGEGKYGATLYSDAGVPNSGIVDLGEPPTAPYGAPNTWALAIRDPDTPESTPTAVGKDTDEEIEWNWRTTAGGEPPS